MPENETPPVVQEFLRFLQRDRRIRIGIGVLIVVALLGYAAKSAYDLRPRVYTLTISGGDIINNRHRIARVLQDEGKKRGLSLIVKPIVGTFPLLEAVSEGKVDLGFIQGGLDVTYPQIEHVATIQPELVHLLVKPGITGMGDLKGHSVNLGGKDSGSRQIGVELTRFAGYVENVDFVETNFTAEQLLALPARKMPDAIITVSSVPSYLVDILVHRYRYQVVEIPFPEALALRHGWATNGSILPYTYDISPPTPATNIRTVAVNMHLVAHAHTDPEAVKRLLELLYSPAVQTRLGAPLDEKQIDVPSGYPISAGLTAYLTRNDSILTPDEFHRLQSLLGLLASLAGMGVVVIRWFRGVPLEAKTDDPEFIARLTEVLTIERRLNNEDAEPAMAELRTLRARLSALRAETLARSVEAKLKDPALVDRCLMNAALVRSEIDRLLARDSNHQGVA